MAKPTRLAYWATSTNYPTDGAPEETTPTKVEPADAKKATGWRPGEFPKAQYLNDWQRLVHQWIDYLGNTPRNDRVSIKEGTPRDATDWVIEDAKITTAGGEWDLPLPIQEGDRPRYITFNYQGDVAATLAVEVRLIAPLGVSTLIASFTQVGLTTWETKTFNFDYESGPMTLEADGDSNGATTSSFLRSSGSWIADGLSVGQAIETSGFDDPANNGFFTIVSLTALEIVVGANGLLVDEVGDGDEELDGAMSTITNSALEVQFAVTGGAGELASSVRFSKDNGSQL